MLRRPLRSSLKIPFPFRSDKLEWYRDPLRVIVPATVGIGGRIYVQWKHHWRSHNQNLIQDLVTKRETGTGLITFGNHQCFIDDSFVWTDLPYSFHLKWSQHRWVLGSADVCFHKFLHQPIKQRLIEWFFCAGKTVPVTHGDGIYQPGIDWAVERLQMGDWVNLYPEGQVNKYNDWMRFYWGIGRMVYEAPKTKILPFFHLGLNEVYPPVGPHERTFRSDKAITMLWGEPISFENEIEAHKATNFEDELSMIESITKRLQEILYKMREECETLHLAHLEELGDQTQIDDFLEKKKDRIEPIAKTENFEKIYFEN